MEPALRPIAIFPRSCGNNCPRCRKAMSVTRSEDFELVNCPCGYSCKQQSGEMKLAYREQTLERTAQPRRTLK